MAISLTTNYNLNKPNKGTRNWDTYLNSNMDIIDVELKRQKDVDTSTNTRIDNIVAQSGTSNTEIVDARNSTEKNITYVTLKDRLESIERSIEYTEGVYGLEWNKISDTYKRLGLATGKDRTFFDTLLPWSGMRRCNLSDLGVVNAYYGDPTYIEDGTNGQVMVKIPKFYYKTETYTDRYRWYISPYELDGYTLHPAFYRDRNGDGTAEEVNYRYFSAYEGILHDGTSYVNGNTYSTDQSTNVTNNATWKLTSISGYTPMPYINITAARTLATRRGNGWGITDFNLLFAVQLLYLIEYASFDSQTKIGKGYSDSTNTGSITTGRTASLGNTSGNESNIGTDGKHAMSYRGIENLYGNIRKWIDGYVTSGTSGSTPITIKIGNVGFNNTGSEYSTTFTSASNFTNISGYISDLWTNQQQLGFTPYICSGSSTTKITDSGRLYAGYLPIYGGSWDVGADAGVFYFYCLSAASNVYANVAARLSF